MSYLASLFYRNETVNPYRDTWFDFGILVSDLWGRMKWDLYPESRTSRKKLKKLKNIHRGGKTVIVCNGPSLLKTDLSLLDGIFTFGLNKINLLFDKTEFRPSTIVVADNYVLDQNAAFFNTTDIPLFVTCLKGRRVRPRPNMIFLHILQQDYFARDCCVSTGGGGTIAFTALQLAYHMGFCDVALIGCDNYYSKIGVPGEVGFFRGKDINHFDERYFQDMAWNVANAARMERSYLLAREVFQQAGRRIFNATEGGRLEVLPRINLKEFLKL